MTIVAGRLAAVRASETKAMAQRAAALRAAGRTIVDLSRGEPDFDTPPSIGEAAIRAIRAGETRYGPVAGAVALREAIRAKLRRDQGIEYPLDAITVGAGAKQVLFNAFLASVDPGDEVIVPAPCWVSYAEAARVAGGVPVLVPGDAADGFALRPDRLERAITPRTRWLVLNSPCNPSGVVLGRAQLAALGEVLQAHPRVWVMSDEIYEELVYPPARFCSTMTAVPALADRLLTINGVSKAHAMTGWRVGYGAGPVELIRAMNTIQGHATSHASSVAQAAALEALVGDQGHIAAFREAYRRRRDLLVDRLGAVAGLHALRPDGAFYVFASCRGWIGRATPAGMPLTSDRDVATFLLESAGVATVPGAAFGASPYLRLSFAASEDELLDACARIEASAALLVAPEPEVP